jgi:hypothetical protein
MLEELFVVLRGQIYPTYSRLNLKINPLLHPQVLDENTFKQQTGSRTKPYFFEK